MYRRCVELLIISQTASKLLRSHYSLCPFTLWWMAPVFVVFFFSPFFLKTCVYRSDQVGDHFFGSSLMDGIRTYAGREGHLMGM